ncbi:MAG: zinc permease [Chloroflexi bacterium]|nr:zinc permease [Chloroflexota bacterium]MCL5274074.1 zinc permease [Chloroflexota bacterium]
MNFAETVLLGAIAGFTIYIGLPMGKLKVMSDKVRSFLSMMSVGIILFLLYDIFGNLAEPIEAALKQAGAGQASYAEFFTLLVIFLVGFGVGLLGLLAFEQRFVKANGAAGQAIPPARLALMIAIGLGLHNFSEGLAIGQSAGSGAIALALLLIIGFGLHNATEGFGIVGPLAGQQPTWGFLGLMGLIGGGPTFLGTVIGYSVVSTPTSVLFLALAEGALIYVLGELLHVNRRPGAKLIAGVGLASGFVLAFLTDMLLIVAGS